jgi:hypothetical protein
MLIFILGLFMESFAASWAGGYGGYRYAIKDVAGSERPSGLWQLSTSLIVGVGGAVIAVFFEIALVMALPTVDTEKLTIVPLLIGVSLGVLMTQRYLRIRR